MAQYYAVCQGGRGEASRLGHKPTGAQARADGWKIGGQTFMSWSETHERDVVNIGITAGSGEPNIATLEAWRREDGEVHAELSDDMLNLLDEQTLIQQLLKNQRLAKALTAALFSSGEASRQLLAQ